MARKERDGVAKLYRRSISSLLIGSLLISSCATTLRRTEIPASVNATDRERCEQFAQSEADVLTSTASWTDPLAGAIGGAILGPVGAGLGMLVGIFKVYGDANADDKARQATYDEVLKDCLEPSVGEAIRGPENSDLGRSYVILADRFSSAGKYDEAERRYRRALTIQEKVLGPDHPDVATTLEAYARVLARLDRQSEAEEIVDRYLSIRERHKQESKATERETPKQ